MADNEPTDSSSSDTEKHVNNSEILLKQKLSMLNGYRPATRLDRQLLKGIFRRDQDLRNQPTLIPSQTNLDCDRTQLSESNALPFAGG